MRQSCVRHGKRDGDNSFPVLGAREKKGTLPMFSYSLAESLACCIEVSDCIAVGYLKRKRGLQPITCIAIRSVKMRRRRRSKKTEENEKESYVSISN